ncbi:hypothetical protein [Acinetobacter genomosp. 15BJ]|uniref:Uncharacterized protein n=1 Tax=Acinetobacter genomosp. 15BJ TaxID=106651 RepID=R9B9V2_9GAMM|nr:hypothetical protein [Acinetobacter genomosp. 15BJ]EOR09171.1 hypothetical protein F896_01020 [Acinetobacter genomosp. 15BJ]MCH7291652.1 hypothetical protein [Acinetobacter genomosp. 15BJ]MDO3658636.1 hypothetical protein [Acinetobacter genomosp. 15BJ]
MNDYLDITASELLRELDHFFLIDTHDGAQTGFWVNEKALTDKHYWMDGDYKVEILRSLQPSHQYAPHDYKITRLTVGENDSNVVLLDYDGVHKKIQTFRRGEWVNRLNKYFYQKERHYLQQLADHPNFQLIQY